MTQIPTRAEYCLQKAAECDLRAKIASNPEAKEVFRGLAEQWCGNSNTPNRVLKAVAGVAATKEGAKPCL